MGNDSQRFNAPRGSEKILFISPVKQESSAPQQVYAPRLQSPHGGRSEDLAENPSGGLLARGSMPFNILSILRNQRESIDTVFPWVRKAKKEKKRWS
jgi:hypothetical protein